MTFNRALLERALTYTLIGVAIWLSTISLYKKGPKPCPLNVHTRTGSVYCTSSYTMSNDGVWVDFTERNGLPNRLKKHNARIVTRDGKIIYDGLSMDKPINHARCDYLEGC